MGTPNITTPGFERLRTAYPLSGCTGHALLAPVSGSFGPGIFVNLIAGMAQGRIVSISRGSPPPEKKE